MAEGEYFPPGIPSIPTTFTFKYDSKEDARYYEKSKDSIKVEKTLTQFCKDQLKSLSLTQLADVTDSEDEEGAAIYPPPPPNEIEENVSRLAKYYDTHQKEDCYVGECKDPRKLQRLIDLDDEAWASWSPETKAELLKSYSSEPRLDKTRSKPVKAKIQLEPSTSFVKANETKSDLLRLKKFFKEKTKDHSEMLFRRLLLVGTIPFSEVEKEIKPLDDSCKDEAFKSIIAKMEDNITAFKATEEANLRPFDSIESYFSYYENLEQVKLSSRVNTSPKVLTGKLKRFYAWNVKWDRRTTLPMFNDFMIDVRNEEHMSRVLFEAEKPTPGEFLLTWERPRPHKNRTVPSLHY